MYKIKDYHKENASFMVYYDEIKKHVLKSRWKKITNKNAFLMNYYKNGYDTEYVIKLIIKTFK